MHRRGTSNMTAHGAYVRKVPNTPVTQRALLLDGTVADVQIPFKRHRHDASIGEYLVDIEGRAFKPIRDIIEVDGEYLSTGTLREIEAPGGEA